MSKRKAAAPSTSPTRRRPANEKVSTASMAAVADPSEQKLLADEPMAGSEPVAEATVNGTAEEPDVPSVESVSMADPAAEICSLPLRASGLDVFLIDSGWNTPVCTAVHENIPTMAAYLKGQRFFVLNQEQSLAYIRNHPAMVGADPVLMVVDRNAVSKKGGRVGFRLCLGHVKRPEVAVAMLKWGMQLTMTATTIEMTRLVEESGHRKTLQGVIELIGEGSAHLIEFAPV